MMNVVNVGTVRRAIPAILAAGIFGILSAAPELPAQERSQGNMDAPQRLTPEERAAIGELREKLRAWAQENVVPTLLEYKRRLDAAMSPGDLAILNDLRKEARTIRRGVIENRKRMREAWEQEDFEQVKEARARISELQQRRIDIADLIVPLAIEYRETLEELGGELRPLDKEWKAQVKEIAEEWKAGQPQELQAKAERFVRLRHMLGEFFPDEMVRHARAVRFMLWDGGMPEKQETPKEPDAPVSPGSPAPSLQ